MPKQLEKCVQDLIDSGKDKGEAYAICGKSTGWVRKKGGGWKNKKTGEVYNESFELVSESFELVSESFSSLFFEGNHQTLNWLRDNKGVVDEIKRLKSLLGKVPNSEEKGLLNLIQWLENKIK